MADNLKVCRDDQVCPVCQNPYVPPVSKPVRTTPDILKYLEHFRDKKQEHVISLSLDSGHRLIARRVVTIGTLESALIHPREVFAGPLTDRAAAVIVAHNHPSGSPQPSKADIDVTQQLAAAGQILGVTLRDHLIITTNEHFSFKSHFLLQ